MAKSDRESGKRAQYLELDLSFSLNSLNLVLRMFSNEKMYSDMYSSRQSRTDFTSDSFCSLPLFFVFDKVTASSPHRQLRLPSYSQRNPKLESKGFNSNTNKHHDMLSSFRKAERSDSGLFILTELVALRLRHGDGVGSGNKSEKAGERREER